MKVYRFQGVMWLLAVGMGIALLAGPNRAGAQQVIADSIADFSAVQGQGNWSYGYYATPNLPSSFTQMTNFIGWAWAESATQPPWTFVSARYQHPRGTNEPGGLEHWSVRRYVSPKAGTLLLQGTLKKADTTPNPKGTGIFGHIFHNGQEVYVQFIGPVDGVGVNYSVTVPDVKVGDTLDFVVAPNGFSGNDSTAFNAQIKLYTRFDYTSDGKPDLILESQSTGGIILWTMNGTTIADRQYITHAYDTDWKIVASGDFNGDAQTDLVFQNQSTGGILVWYMNGASVASRQYLESAYDLNWKVVGAADFNGDGKPDLVFQNSVSGQIAIWLMDGLTRIGTAFVNVNPPAGWQVVATGDFDGDGQTDLLLQNTTSFALRAYLMSGTSVASQVEVYPTSPTDRGISTDWQVVGAADVNGDNMLDILFQNKTSGAIAVWYMNGTSLVSTDFIVHGLDTDWKVSGMR